MGRNNARINDVDTLLQAGIQPTPDEMAHSLNYGKRVPTRAVTRQDFEAALMDARHRDEQVATSRFKWYNLPCNITGEELERFLYYKGQLCFFYLPELDQFFFMPYALDGTIDFYGRYNRIHPVPMSNGTDEKMVKMQADYLADVKLDCVYGIPLVYKPEMMFNSCVLLHDHVKQLSETIIPRRQLNEYLCKMQAEMLCYMNTAALLGCGIKGMRVGSDDEKAQALIANKSIKDAALKQEAFIPMIGNVEWQNLMEKNDAKVEEYQLALQAIDNYRLAGLGLGDGRVSEKKSHMLQTEADQNQSNVGLILSSDLSIRQNFCNIVNNIWGLGIWCEPNEAYAGEDLNGDGNDYSSDTDGSQAAVETGE